MGRLEILEARGEAKSVQKLSIRKWEVLGFLQVKKKSNNLEAGGRKLEAGERESERRERLNLQNVNLCRLERGPVLCFLQLTSDSNSGMCRLEIG